MSHKTESERAMVFGSEAVKVIAGLCGRLKIAGVRGAGSMSGKREPKRAGLARLMVGGSLLEKCCDSFAS